MCARASSIIVKNAARRAFGVSLTPAPLRGPCLSSPSYLNARSESDEAPALAASVLWKLGEYQDFIAPLLKAEAADACAAAVEDLGPPLAGPLQNWLQVSVQVQSFVRVDFQLQLMLSMWGPLCPAAAL